MGIKVNLILLLSFMQLLNLTGLYTECFGFVFASKLQQLFHFWWCFTKGKK